MKMFWLVFAIVLFVFITVKCFTDGYETWVFYYSIVLLAVGMYFFKTWMMNRMEKHLEFMTHEEFNSVNDFSKKIRGFVPFEIEEEIGLMDVIKGLPENKEIA